MFGVSRRTVSRWEIGSNMPDLTLLVEMADYFDVDSRELLDGERKSELMDKELKETNLFKHDMEMPAISKNFSANIVQYATNTAASMEGIATFVDVKRPQVVSGFYEMIMLLGM